MKEMFILFGDRCGGQKTLILAMKARKWLVSGYTGCFASVVDTTKKEKDKLNNVPMLNEFTSVCPKDLPSLPPDREVMFDIEVLPKTMLISKAPYRMAPAELKELQTQLQDLLDKGLFDQAIHLRAHLYCL